MVETNPLRKEDRKISISRTPDPSLASLFRWSLCFNPGLQRTCEEHCGYLANQDTEGGMREFSALQATLFTAVNIIPWRSLRSSTTAATKPASSSSMCSQLKNSRTTASMDSLHNCMLPWHLGSPKPSRNAGISGLPSTAYWMSCFCKIKSRTSCTSFQHVATRSNRLQYTLAKSAEFVGNGIPNEWPHQLH